MQKITKKDRYLEIRSLILDRPDLVEFIDHEIELVEKKNASRSLKPSKSATENAVLADSVLAVMKEGNRYTITEIQRDLITSVQTIKELIIPSSVEVIKCLKKGLRMSSANVMAASIRSFSRARSLSVSTI